ncbi:MAG: hypothetical protein FJW61_04480 [Actinobacteria bacterium]|nr:hypothetical protein [Actinomycetota bacterium]
MNENGDNISKIKARIKHLIKQRGLSEKYLLAHHILINASFIKMDGLAHGKKRKTPAYYLSRKIDGVTKLTYIKTKDLTIVRRRALAYKYYIQNLAKFVKISKEIEASFRELAILSLEVPDGYKWK